MAAKQPAEKMAIFIKTLDQVVVVRNVIPSLPLPIQSWHNTLKNFLMKSAILENYTFEIISNSVLIFQIKRPS